MNKNAFLTKYTTIWSLIYFFLFTIIIPLFDNLFAGRPSFSFIYDQPYTGRIIASIIVGFVNAHVTWSQYEKRNSNRVDKDD